MHVYKYRAVMIDGTIVDGSMESENEDEVLKFLDKQSCYPVTIKMEKGFLHSKNLFHKSIPIKQIAIFLKQFSTMLEGGLSIVSCLEIIAGQIKHKNFSKILSRIAIDIQTGSSFSKALQNYSKQFPKLLIQTIHAGESNGKLEDVLKRLEIHYNKQYKIQCKIVNALIYPSILLVVSILIISILTLFVMPSFMNAFKNMHMDIPFLTKVFLFMSDHVVQYGVIDMIAFLGIGVLFYIRLRNNKQIIKVLQKSCMKIPIIKEFFSNMVASRFSRILYIVLNSGTSIITGLENMSSMIGLFHIEKEMELLIQSFCSGNTLAQSMEKIEIFPHMLISMVDTGEKSNRLEPLLESSAEFYEAKIENTVQRIITFIEPTMILFISIIIGFIILSMLLPYFSMIDNISI